MNWDRPDLTAVTANPPQADRHRTLDMISAPAWPMSSQTVTGLLMRSCRFEALGA
jgi:hypothetical protein